MHIIEAIEDKRIFGSLFKDQETWANWKVFLKSMFAIPMMETELSTFGKYTGRDCPPSVRVKECFAIVGRRGGKSFVSALIACWLAALRIGRPTSRRGSLPGSWSSPAIREQARVIFGYIRAIMGLKMFRCQIAKELSSEIHLKNRVIISIKTCDYRALRGYTIAAAVLDELAFYRSSEAYISPAKEILTAIRPALSSLPNSLFLGSVHHIRRAHIFAPNLPEKYGKDDADFLCWKAPTLAMNPSLSRKTIERAFKEDAVSARSEYDAEFREDLQTFIQVETLDTAIFRAGGSSPRFRTFAIMPSPIHREGSADSFTLGIAFRDEGTGRIILAKLMETKPPSHPRKLSRFMRPF